MDVAQVEDRRRIVGVDARAETRAHARIERRDDRHDGAVVRVHRIWLARLFEQRLAAVDPDVSEHEVVVPEQQRVDVDLAGDQVCSEEQLARFAPRRGVRIRLVIRRTVFVRVAGAELVGLERTEAGRVALSAQSSHTFTSRAVTGTQPPVTAVLRAAVGHSIEPISIRPRIRLLRIDAMLLPRAGPSNFNRSTPNAVPNSTTNNRPMTIGQRRLRLGDFGLLTRAPERTTPPTGSPS